MTTPIGTLTIEMAANVARLQQDMQQAKNTVSDAMKSMQQAVDVTKAAFISLAGVASVDALVGMVRSTITATAELGKLATQTGMTVEQLSGLAAVGKATQTSAETIGAAANKMSKALATSGEESKGAATAIKALGLNFDELKTKTPDQQMKSIADAMANFKDGGEKAAAAMLIFGKSGAEMLPYLKDLAATGELHAKVTTQQAEAARQFEKDMARLKAMGEAWKRSLAMELLPTLSEIVNIIADTKKSTSDLGTMAGQGLTVVVQTIGVLYLNVKYVLEQIFNEVVGIGKQLAALAMLDWSKFKSIGEKTKADAAAARAEVDRLSEAILNAGKVQKQVVDSNAGKSVLSGLDGGNAKEKVDPQIKAYADLVAAIREKIAANNLEADTGKKLTEAQTLDLQIKKDVEKGTISAAQASKLRASGLLDEVDASEKAKDAAARLKKENDDAIKAYADTVEAQQKAAQSLRDQVEAQRLQTAEIGLTKEQIGDLEAAKLRDQAASKSRLATMADEVDATGALGDAYRAQADALREMADLKKEAAAKQTAVDEAKKAAEEWKKVTDQIDQAGTTAILDMFTKGRDAATAFRDTLVAMFKTMVLRPVISFILNPITGGIGSILGLSSGAASAASGASGLSGLSGLGSIGSAISAFGGTFATGAMNTIFGTGAGAGLDAAGAMMANGATASGLGMGIGAVAPYALAAVAAYKVLQSLNGGETRSGGQYGVAYDGTVTNNRRGESYTRVGQQYNRDAGNQTALTNGQAYLMEADGLGSQDSAVRAAVSSTASSIDGFLKDLGSSARLGQFFAGLETSGEGRGGVMAGGKFADGTAFGSSGTGSNYAGTFYDKAFSNSPDMKTALADFTTELKQTTVQALQAAKDIPQAAKDLLGGVDAKALSDTEAAALLQKVSDQITAVKTFQAALSTLQIKTLGDVTYDAAAKIVQALGGIDAAQKTLSSYYQNYYSEAERVKAQTDAVNKQFAALGLSMPSTREEFRKLVESCDLSTDAGRAMYAALLQLSEAFAAVVPATQAATTAVTAQADAAQALAEALTAAKAAASAAYDALSRSVQVQLDAATAAETTANAQISAVNSVMGVLRSNIQGLLSQTSAAVTAEQGRQFIQAALASGTLPDATALGDAISAARSGLVDSNYASQYEADRDRRVLVGQLQALQDAAGSQLTDAQRQLQAAQDQTKRLDDLLKNAKSQLDALNGIDTSITDVGTALAAFTDALKTALGLQRGTGSTNAASQTGAGPSGGGATFGPGGSSAASSTAKYNREFNLGNGAFTMPVTDGAEVSRLDGLASLGAKYSGTGDVAGLLADAKAAGASLSDLATVYGYSYADVLKAATNLGVPAFADGGVHSGGWALVGEQGPELAYFNAPAHIYTASQTRALRNDSTDTTSDSNAERRAEATAQASLTSRMVRLLERWEANGMPQVRAS